MSLLDVQVAALTNIGMNYLATGKTPKRFGNRLATVYPSDNFRCSDGEIMLIVGNDEQFRRFCQALKLQELAEDPRFASNSARLEHTTKLAPIIAQALASKTVLQCEDVLAKAGVLASRINDMAQVFADPHILARGMVREIDGLDGRRQRIIANPIRMSRTPPSDIRPPPKLGEHTAEVEQGWPGIQA